MQSFNHRIRQLILLAIILLLVVISVVELKTFLPGLLGAITLYILSRSSYFRFIYKRKWKKGLTALLYVFFYLILFGIPFALAILLISPKLNTFLEDPSGFISDAKVAVMHLQQKTGMQFVSAASLEKSLSGIVSFVPTILNSTANLVSNLAIMLFLLYYMLYNAKDMELALNRYIPLKQRNINMLASETRVTVKANALGIPLISIIQGITATLGYFIFGVQDWALWGFLTGVFAFFPVVGTMLIWVPLVIFLYASGENGQATGVLLYSAIVTGNVDYAARITLLKKIGDVHPVVTIMGVLIGLNLFGFIGLVFGPLLLNYILVLFRIYMNEFVDNDCEDYDQEVEKKNQAKREGKEKKQQESEGGE